MGDGGMAQAIEPREAEAMAITLTRMEGKLDSVVEKVSDLRAEVTLHRGEIRALQSVTQQLESDMKGAEEARTLAAAAVKAADEARVAMAKAAVDNSTQQWTPFQRLFAVFIGLAALATIAFSIYMMTH
jgi:predicted  nucleic acid-binding Zn-ribbon protein